MEKVITRPEAYQIPVRRFFKTPYATTPLPEEAGEGTLRNLRPFPDWRLSRLADPAPGPRRDIHHLTYAIRDGGGFAGRPNHAETWSPQECANHLSHLAITAPENLWVAFSDHSTNTDDGVAIARFMGVVINPEHARPSYQPVVLTKLGETALVPDSYIEGWLHIEV